MKLPIVIRVFKNDQLESVKQFTESQIVIGYADSVQLKLSGEEVSPLHAVIEERDTGYYISDLGSQTGTRLNGKKILDEPISSGETIELGSYRLDFFIGIPKPMTPPLVKENKDFADVPTQVVTQAPYPTVVTPSPQNFSAPKIPEDLPPLKQVGVKESVEKIEKTEVTKVVTANHSGTFAPPSDIKNLSEVLKPGKGTVVEVIVAWKERILNSFHFKQKGMVRIGSSADNEIVLPVLIGTLSHSLVRLSSMATVCVTGDMSGELISESGTKPFSELIRLNRMIRNNVGYEINLDQGEMLRIGMSGDLIHIFIRYVAEAPKPVVAPLLDLSASEVTGVILAAVVALTFGLYMMVYAPKKLAEENLLEEPLRKAVVIFKPPKISPPEEKPEPKVDPVPEKKIVKIVEKEKPAPTQKPAPMPTPTPPKQVAKKSSSAQPSDSNPGKAGEAKPNPNKTNKKILTSTREGGAINTGKSGASPTSEKVDVSKVGLLNTFGSRGTQSKLNKAYSGSGELTGLADSATGFAGQAEDREGDNMGSKLKSAGAGGKGTSTVGIAGVGTTGRGSGSFGYGTGGLGKKSRVEVQVGGQEAEFVGSIDREAIRRTVLAHKGEIRNCYELALSRNPDLYGKLSIQWDIEERGRVSNVIIVGNSLGNKSVADCLVQHLKTWRFPDPPPDQVGRVTYPFVFASQ